jgi:hypothetical protein
MKGRLTIHGKADNGAQLLQAIRNSGTANPGWAARVGSLAPREGFAEHLDDVIATALMGDLFDIFCMGTAYGKRMAERNGANFRARPTGSDLRFLTMTANPKKYFAVIGGVGELLNMADPLQSLSHAAPNPHLFRLVCGALVAGGVDLHSIIANTRISGGSLELLTSNPESFRVCLVYYRPLEDQLNLYPLLKSITMQSLESARRFLEMLQRESITNVFGSEDEHGQLLLNSISLIRSGQGEAGSESEAVRLP